MDQYLLRVRWKTYGALILLAPPRSKMGLNTTENATWTPSYIFSVKNEVPAEMRPIYFKLTQKEGSPIDPLTDVSGIFLTKDSLVRALELPLMKSEEARCVAPDLQSWREKWRRKMRQSSKKWRQKSAPHFSGLDPRGLPFCWRIVFWTRFAVETSLRNAKMRLFEKYTSRRDTRTK